MAAAKTVEKKQMVQTKEEHQAAMVVNNSFIDGLVKQLNKKCEYGMSFPADYNVSNALMGAYLVLKETEDKNKVPLLQSCSQASIANALMDMATLGLSVQKKQGYFIAYGKKCQFQRSYFGNITIARRYGLKEINAEVIYEGDDFQYRIENGKKIFEKHNQDFMNIDNTKIKGAYAVVTMEDGTKYLEVMNFKQIEQSWKQGYGYKGNSQDTTHAKFADQMAKKTVTNRALKQIINTHGDAFVQEADTRTEEVSHENMVVAEVNNIVETEANKEEFSVEPEAEVEKIPAEEVEIEDKKVSKAEETDLPDFMTMEEA